MINNITLGKPKNILRSIILNILASISNLIPFIALAKIVENLFVGSKVGNIDTGILWKYFGVMALFFLITLFFENLATKYTYELGYQRTAEGRIGLASHIRSLPIGFISGKSSSEILDTLMNDFAKVETATTHQLPQFFSSIFVALLCGIFFLIIKWYIFCIADYFRFILTDKIRINCLKLRTAMFKKITTMFSCFIFRMDKCFVENCI